MKIGQQKNAFFAGDFLPGPQGANAADRIAAKKRLYGKQGMHAVTGVNDSEKRMDQSMKDVIARVHGLAEENEEADRFLQEANRKMAQAKEDYQIAPDSQEEKDLDLLKKKFDIEHRRTSERLTEEEERRLEEMGELTEYQSFSMDCYEQADHWKYQILENKKEMRATGSVIRHVKLTRLESHAMEDAMRAKEKLMVAAAKDAVGVLTGEAVDAMDEKSEDVKEAAEAKREEREEQEEQIEASREQKEDAEAAAREKRKNASERVEQAMMNEISTSSIDAEIQKILKEEKMLEEELKGLRVNMGI